MIKDIDSVSITKIVPQNHCNFVINFIITQLFIILNYLLYLVIIKVFLLIF